MNDTVNQLLDHFLAELDAAGIGPYRAVLHGSVPLAELTVSPVDLRQALERELRGKLLRLRQGYALLSDDPKRMGEFVQRTLSAVLFLCRGVVLLAGEVPPQDPVELAN